MFLLQTAQCPVLAADSQSEQKLKRPHAKVPVKGRSSQIQITPAQQHSSDEKVQTTPAASAAPATSTQRESS